MPVDGDAQRSGPRRRFTTRIELAVIRGEIQELGVLEKAVTSTGDPVDAIAVGHYLGVRPVEAELALDRALSAALPSPPHGRDDVTNDDLILTQFTDRGVIRGDLGQVFFLHDARSAASGGDGRGVERVIAIAGMGVPAQFGEPELTVLARELCWSVGRLGKRHLATVVIGNGRGNLDIDAAISGWVRGIKRAVTGVDIDGPRQVRRVTFVVRDPGKISAVQDAILRERDRLSADDRMTIDYDPIPGAALERFRGEALERQIDQLRHGRATAPRGETDPPTRLTIGFERRTYRFGAITALASVPEREVELDPTLAIDANTELGLETDRRLQLERGRFLEQLLVPDELRDHMSGREPLVLMLDATTARIHWEMVAQPIEGVTADDEAVADDEEPLAFDPDLFLGTSRGLTRQLRTTFAPPPQPPPPPRRVLRVLIVADAAPDDPLPKAREEAEAIEQLFGEFNRVYDAADNEVEVTALVGPEEATRTNVLRHLMLHKYDVLHYAGHSEYDDTRDPPVSGWIFQQGYQPGTPKRMITADELRRIDRVPEFVFSNSCQSGVTPERATKRNDRLAPSFAEAFFERGVGNFVCTAWEVIDDEAIEFARVLYRELLGLAEGSAAGKYEPTEPKAMHLAMRTARIALAHRDTGVGTWGAYQHYGNPNLRFFDPSTLRV
ncbi:MAG: CHAT domain-containing protein [Chloroflexota bacterium]